MPIFRPVRGRGDSCRSEASSQRLASSLTGAFWNGLLSTLYCSTLSTQSVAWRLTLERRMWNDSIVLVYVECRLLAYVVDRFKRVQVRPSHCAASK